MSETVIPGGIPDPELKDVFMRLDKLEDKNGVATRAAELLIEQLAAVVEPADAGKVFSVGLSGGSTPKLLHSLLTNAPWREKLPWDRINWFFGDERFVRPDHKDSNFRMARETLFLPAEVGINHQFPMIPEGIIETESPQEIAARYADIMNSKIQKKASGFPQLDVLFLGMGDDGHTASLFPHTPALSEETKTVCANRVDKLDTWRITLTRPTINAAKLKIILVTGSEKAAALSAVLEGSEDVDKYPSQMLRSMDNVTWLVDHAAAAQLKL